MSQRVIKEKRLEYLLDRMKSEPMNNHQMADAICCDLKCAQKYITELRFKKKIYIEKYERRSGSYAVYYMAGNKPDAIRPEPISQVESNKRYKAKTARVTNFNEKLGNYKFVPRMDIAASWLRNPC